MNKQNNYIKLDETPECTFYKVTPELSIDIEQFSEGDEK